MLCLNDDSKVQMRLNIKLHRQKLLQCLEKSNDTVLKPKIKLVSNNLEKFNLNHNVKPKIAPSTELINSKLEPTKVTNHRTRSTVQQKQLKPVITTKEKNVDIKKHKTRSSVTLNQLKPNIKVNIKAELPISNVELKPTPIPIIEKKDPESPEPIIKKLKEQLIEELYNSSSSSEDIDDNISVGSNEDWNDFFDSNSTSDVYDNDSSNSIPVGVNKYEHEKPDNKKSIKDSSYYSNDSVITQSDSKYPVTRKRTRSRRMVLLTNSQHKSNSPKKRFRKPQDRTIHNAKERACRERIAQKFDILRKSCSYLNTNRRVPSKHSILLAAKKECDLLKHFESKLVAEKKVWRKANDVLKNKIAKLTVMIE
ncbi:hypothetical protein AGLY_003158 [Aphis glycines]|uniref:BHLH domain-containing protein n=1 Tax=Aphis glycines TaxID=307491 RepID=A0A6G0U2R3_APHGL|nr:hypothetical protein AGLY_003158 [Aphis glycines]